MESFSHAAQYALLATLAIPFTIPIPEPFLSNTLKSALTTLPLSPLQKKQLEQIEQRITDGASVFHALKDSLIFDDNVRFIFRAASDSPDAQRLALNVALDYLKTFGVKAGHS